MKHFLLIACLMAAACSAPKPVEKAQPAPRPVKITQFYASPGIIPPGGKALLCYGVEGAKTVELEPKAEDIHPSFSRCIEVTPKSTTTYTLRATGASGDAVTQTTALTVDPKAPRTAPVETPSQQTLIQFFTTSTPQVRPGQAVTLCYSVKGAKKVTLEPPLEVVPASENRCFTRQVDTTSTFTLKATDAMGGVDRETVTVQVR